MVFGLRCLVLGSLLVPLGRSGAAGLVDLVRDSVLGGGSTSAYRCIAVLGNILVGSETNVSICRMTLG
jgi:hypothetical protein